MKAAQLAARTTGAFPLSISTSLAMESIFDNAPNAPYDPLRVIPQRIKLSDYEEFWINLETLHRNITGAMQREDIPGIMSFEMVDTLFQEIDFIKELCSSSGGSCRPVFYHCDYKGIPLKFKGTLASFRQDTTDIQKLNAKNKEDSIKLLLANSATISGILSVHDKLLSAGKKPKVLLLSHIPYDLTSKSNFSDMHLIESHTGVLKKPGSFYTKYYNGKDLSMIPFKRGLMPVFGDKETFHPLSMKIKKAVIDLSLEHRWNQVTSVERIVQCMKLMPDKELANNLIAMMHL